MKNLGGVLLSLVVCLKLQLILTLRDQINAINGLEWKFQEGNHYSTTPADHQLSRNIKTKIASQLSSPNFEKEENKSRKFQKNARKRFSPTFLDFPLKSNSQPLFMRDQRSIDEPENFYHQDFKRHKRKRIPVPNDFSWTVKAIGKRLNEKHRGEQNPSKYRRKRDNKRNDLDEPTRIQRGSLKGTVLHPIKNIASVSSQKVYNKSQESNKHRPIRRVSENGDLVNNNTNFELPVHKRTSVQYSSLVGPSFVKEDTNMKTHALAGQTAHLNCFVKNLHNYTVSWIRLEDINLLTSGDVTYSSDNRLVAANPAKGERWVLKIHHVELSDAGSYLCQVSTSPPIDCPVQLVVTKATAKVSPAEEVFLKVGSPVKLTCIIEGCPYPSLPTWYKGNQQLQKDITIHESSITPTTTTKSLQVPSSTISNAADVDDANETLTTKEEASIAFHKLPPISASSDPLQDAGGVLLAKVVFERPKASIDLSGVYTCTNTCTPPVNLTLNVLVGDEETAAMQHINEVAPLIHNLNVVILLMGALFVCR